MAASRDNDQEQKTGRKVLSDAMTWDGEKLSGPPSTLRALLRILILCILNSWCLNIRRQTQRQHAIIMCMYFNKIPSKLYFVCKQNKAIGKGKLSLNMFRMKNSEEFSTDMY